MTDDNNIANIGEEVRYKKNEVIFLQNEAGNEMYILLEGKAGVYINSFDEFPVRIAEITMGSIVGEMSILDGSPRSATIISETDSVLLSIKKESLPLLLTSRPDMAMRLLETLSQRIRSLNDMVSSLGNRDKKVILSCFDIETVKSEILPLMNKSYDALEPERYKNLLYEKDMACPVCGKVFTSLLPNYTAIRVKTITKELRKVYADFDTVWYDIVVCPECCYSNFLTQFNNMTEEQKESLGKSGYQRKIQKFGGYSAVRNINQVIDAFCRAIFCNMCMGNILTEAKLWLRLYWLHSDLNDEEMRKYTASKAIPLFDIVCGEGRNELESKDVQQALTIAAELNLYLGGRQRAVECYRDVLMLGENVNSYVYKQALSSLSELGVSISEIRKWKKGIRS